MTLVNVTNRHITINNGTTYQQPSFGTMFMMPMYNLFGAIFSRMAGGFMGGGNIFCNPYAQGGTYVNPLPPSYQTQINPYYVPQQTNLGVGDYFVPQQYNVPTATSTRFNNTMGLHNTYVGSFNYAADYTKLKPTIVSGTQSVSSVSNPTLKTNYGKKDLNFWKSLGYNPERGQQLVDNAKRSQYRGQKHQCVAVVRESINQTYYGGAQHYSRFGKACNIGDQFLCNDSHFKKIIPDWDVSPEDFPPGAIIVYNGDNGNGGYVRGDNRGHGEIAYGDGSGKGISNYDLKIKPQHIKEVWIPV